MTRREVKVILRVEENHKPVLRSAKRAPELAVYWNFTEQPIYNVPLTELHNEKTIKYNI